MFNRKKVKQLEDENKQLKEELMLLEAALLDEGHQHQFVVLEKKLLNGFEVSNGMSSEYLIRQRCATCGKTETTFQVEK